MRTAEAGYGFAENAEYFCGLLKEPVGTYTVDELQDYIDELLVLAKTALEEAESMCRMLRGNREKFNEVQTDLSMQVIF